MADVVDFDFDTKLSEVADLISFSNPADGTHLYRLVFCGKDLSRGDDPVMGVSFVYQKVGTVELVNPDAIDAPVGSIWMENFTGHEKAKKVFRLRVTQIFGKDNVEQAEKEDKNLGYFVAALEELIKEGLYLQMVTKITTSKSKKDKNVTYENVRIQDLQAIESEYAQWPDGVEVFQYEPTLPE